MPTLNTICGRDIVAWCPQVNLEVSGFGGGSAGDWLRPSDRSSVSSNGWRQIRQAIATVFAVPTTTSLMVGNTDTRHYWGLAEDIYRFSPVVMHVDDVRTQSRATAQAVYRDGVVAQISGEKVWGGCSKMGKGLEGPKSQFPWHTGSSSKAVWPCDWRACRSGCFTA